MITLRNVKIANVNKKGFRSAKEKILQKTAGDRTKGTFLNASRFLRKTDQSHTLSPYIHMAVAFKTL